MAEPFLGQISVFGFNFAPYQWAMCQGQILPIQQYAALFSLLGTNFGGNGTSNFGLPNMQGNVGVSQGTGRGGGSTYVIGEFGGDSNVTITNATAPLHTHNFMEATGNVSTNAPAGNVMAKVVGQASGRSQPAGKIYTPTPPAPNTILNAPISTAGGNQPHVNIQPYIALNYCISLAGVFPQFS